MSRRGASVLVGVFFAVCAVLWYYLDGRAPGL